MEEIQVLRDTSHELEKMLKMIQGLLHPVTNISPTKWQNDLVEVKKFSRNISRKLVLLRKMVDVVLS